jgi:hypothetical protein
MDESFTLGQRARRSAGRRMKPADPPPKHAAIGRRSIGRIPPVVVVTAVALVVGALVWLVFS